MSPLDKVDDHPASPSSGDTLPLVQESHPSPASTVNSKQQNAQQNSQKEKPGQSVTREQIEAQIAQHNATLQHSVQGIHSISFIILHD